MICPECGTDNRPGARFCARCGAPLAAETVAWPVAVQKKYPILRALSTIYKVLGGIVAVLTTLGAIGFCIAMMVGGAATVGLERELGTPLPGIASGIVGGLFVLLYGGFIAVTLYAFGEMVSLFISMEENIRSLAQR